MIIYLNLPEWPHTTFSGSSFQGMTTRCEKKFLRGSRFDLSLYIFKVCLLRRVSPLAKKVTSGIRSKPCMILCVSSRSPLFRLSSNVVRLHSFNLCSYGNFLNEVIILVARCWTCSSAFISFFKYGAHHPMLVCSTPDVVLITVARHELSGIASQFAMQNLRFAM